MNVFENFLVSLYVHLVAKGLDLKQIIVALLSLKTELCGVNNGDCNNPNPKNPTQKIVNLIYFPTRDHNNENYNNGYIIYN